MALMIMLIFGCANQKAMEDQSDSDSTIAIWLFDEQPGLYPSKVLHDVGPEDNVLVLGRAGYIVEGKFGNALEVNEPRYIDYPNEEDLPEKIGMEYYEIPEGRTVEPMRWQNAFFASLMTSGENQMRKEIGFPQATQTGLNLGSDDWTVEFWYKPLRRSDEDGVIFEIGEGPRGENNHVTRLMLNSNREGFTLFNFSGDVNLNIPSDRVALDHQNANWSHLAFVYDSDENHIRHYVNGKLQSRTETPTIKSLDTGDEDYFTIGTDGIWERPLPGTLDELRLSHGQIYNAEFETPGSFRAKYLNDEPQYNYKKGPPLLFDEKSQNDPVVELGGRKHLFIDDAIVERMENITFHVNPPRVAEEVIPVGGDFGAFRKHLDVVEDEDGRIRIYNALGDDYLGVWISEDGINFEEYPTGIEHKGRKNIVIPDEVGTGSILYDENAPQDRRWNYITGYQRRGVYLYTSPDGFNFTRQKQALFPFRAATQNDVFYDDQRQLYIGYWRTGFPRTPANATQREFTMSETENLIPPLPYTSVTAEETHEVAKTKRLSTVIPWYMDNGPLTPGKFGIEFPTIFKPEDGYDPPSAGVYNPKAIKYPWAPDTYVAFPVYYFHYYEEPEGRQYHIEERGGGPAESQFAVSRDGKNWTRYPRPAYLGIGRFGDLDMVQNFIARGMIHRGEEIWQYVFLDSDYHSAAQPRTHERSVYRLVQRYDGFVSAEAPYEKYGEIVTRPIKFDGNRLVLNIDTDAHGYATVGLLDEDYNPIPGYSFDDAVYINGDFLDIEAEWLDKGKDVSSLQGQNIRVAIKMRGSKLYSIQFQE
ncbi:MAG: LamG-like jellyroll fold domain-containing protein [Balneolales bacterium]